MRKSVALALCALAAAACSPSASPTDLVISNITVIDGTGAAPRVAHVIVDGGRIVSVASAGASAAPRATIEVDGTGRFLIPGLIDSHVHLASVTPRPGGLDELLSAGVTTVRDMGGVSETLAAWRDEVSRSERSGPEIMIVGATLNGAAVASFHRVVERPEDAAAAVAEMAALGAAQIKVHNSLTPEAFIAIIEAAGAAGLDVVGHIPAGPGPLGACQAGMREISHAAALLEAVLWRADAPAPDLIAALEELGGPASDPLYACMSEAGMAFAPNLSMYAPIIESASAQQADMTRRLVARLGAIALYAHERGAPILVGTDADGSGERPGFGEGVHDELQLLVDSGFSPMDALRAATSIAARHLGREGDIGVVTAGAQADLVILTASPLEDIANSRGVEMVIADGVPVVCAAPCPRAE